MRQSGLPDERHPERPVRAGEAMLRGRTVSAAKKETRGKIGQRARRRRRKFAAAAGAMLLVPGVVAADPATVLDTGDLSALGDAGRGLMGLGDPGEVGAD